MFILTEIFNLAMLRYFHFKNISYFYSVRQKMELNRVTKNKTNKQNQQNNQGIIPRLNI